MQYHGVTLVYCLTVVFFCNTNYCPANNSQQSYNARSKVVNKDNNIFITSKLLKSMVRASDL